MKISKKALKEIHEIIDDHITTTNIHPELKEIIEDDTPIEFWSKEKKCIFDWWTEFNFSLQNKIDSVFKVDR